jgi:hypothetical protein
MTHTACEKTVAMDPPASRVPAVRARALRLERELIVLRSSRAASALAVAEGVQGAAAGLAELHRKITLAEFELANNGLAQDFAVQLDQAALVVWRAEVQTLPPEEIITGITREACCRRCLPGNCVMAGAGATPSDCIHPVLTGELHFNAHKANPKIVAVYRAAVAKVGRR